MCYKARVMKKLIPVMMLLALGLTSCVKTVTRKELLTPSLSTVMDHTELTDMAYYGSDNEYDYFKRGYSRYRVLRSENTLPEAARFTFDNWQTSKLYRECLTSSVKDTLTNKLQNLLNGNSASVQQLPATTTPSTTTQPKTQVGKALQGLFQR